MMLYLDSSALVKRYVSEIGTAEVQSAIEVAAASTTSVATRAEVGAALAKAVRVGLLDPDDGRRCSEVFRREWPRFVRLPLNESTAARADSLAWEYGLRGFDALHLATALTAREMLAAPVTMATFDRRLWAAAGEAGLGQLPQDLPALLDR